MTADEAAAVLSAFDSVRAWQEDFYRDLYSRPELSHQEHRTAADVAARLRDAGCEVHEQVGGAGVVGVLWTSDIVSTRPAAPRSVGMAAGSGPWRMPAGPWGATGL